MMVDQMEWSSRTYKGQPYRNNNQYYSNIGLISNQNLNQESRKFKDWRQNMVPGDSVFVCLSIWLFVVVVFLSWWMLRVVFYIHPRTVFRIFFIQQSPDIAIRQIPLTKPQQGLTELLINCHKNGRTNTQ